MKIQNFKEFEGIRWYSKGKLTLDPDRDINVTDYDFKIGDSVVLIDRIDAFFNSPNNFRDSQKSVGTIMKVNEHGTKEIKGHICVHCEDGGWYKVDCVRRVTNESIRWYTSGALLPPEDGPEENTDIKVGDFIKLKDRNSALYNGSRFLDTDHIIGNKMGTVTEIKTIKDFICVGSSYNGRFYKMDCVELDD